MNLPFGVVSLVVVWSTLHLSHEVVSDRKIAIDWWGAISRTGHYRTFPIVGTILLGAGLWLFSTMTLDTPKWETSVCMVVLGAGMGCLMQTTTLIARTAWRSRTWGRRPVRPPSSGGSSADSSGFTPAALQRLPPAVQHLFRQAVVDGTQAIFLVGAVITAVGVVLSWFVKQVPLRDSNSLQPPTPEKAAEEVESLIA